VLSDLSWILATHPDPRVRDSRQAIALAERAAALTRKRDPIVLDVLAAAYASGGRFDAAIATAQAAVDLVPERDAARASTDIMQRLALYRQQQPYVDTRGTGPIRVGP